MVKELEVKILNIDLEEMERKIISLGGRLIAKETQVNTLIDSTTKPIKESINAYLRLRETKDGLNNKNNITLTLKKIISTEGLRENIEMNSEVENKEAILQIFHELGYDKIEEGFKERKSYSLQNARFDLDIWDEKTYPYPYMEIEVESQEELDKMIKLLNISEENISTKSIMELKEELK
jgi:adenylate cyclase class 2